MVEGTREVLEIPYDGEGVLITRENRFLGIVDITKPESLKGEKVHIQDPGRLEDILYPGNRVLLKKAHGNKRKTGWELIAGKVKQDWVLINSGYHRRIARWVIDNKIIPALENIDSVKPEQRFGESRLDFLLEGNGKRVWVEVKGCTMLKDRVALFPDAPTSRGKRHVEELVKAVEMGDSGMILILVFRPEAQCFSPNDQIDPKFAEAFNRAVEKGVQVCPIIFSYEKGKINYISGIPLCRAEHDIK